jgi:hypothetical protein
MRFVALLTLLPTLAFAQDLPADAPIADPPLMVIVKSGELIDREGSSVAVSSGLYLNDVAAIKVAKRIAAAEAENKSLKESIEAQPDGISLSTVLICVAGALALGTGAGLLLRR